jgi:hypothetical protein
VLLGRIELPTSPLPRECSTTELQQRLRRRGYDRRTDIVKLLATSVVLWQSPYMEKKKPIARSDRLANALRENLRRRKAKAPDPGPHDDVVQSEPKAEL